VRSLLAMTELISLSLRGVDAFAFSIMMAFVVSLLSLK
jgi:hypothetical protein